TRRACVVQLLCIGHRERPAGHGGLVPTAEADLALYLLYESKALFHPIPDCVIF
ncbi:hypothetical protein DBR06_SOUSAS8110013, partial [Sousa chinensis]